MTRASRSAASKSSATPPASPESVELTPAIDNALFIGLTALLAARPLIPESFTSIEFSFLTPLTEGLGPTPMATVALDWLILLLAAIVAWRRPLAWGGWPLAGGVLLLAAVLVSSWAAGNPRAALNAGANLVVGLLGGWALLATLRQRWMTHLLLAATITTGSVAALKCVLQWSYEFDETLDSWVKVEKPRLAAAGLDVTDPLIEDYERRMRSREAYGYLSHPNIAAACLSAALLPLLGCVAGLSRRGGMAAGGGLALLLAVALSALLLFAMKLTGSSGALLALAVAAGLLLGYRVAGGWFDGGRRRLFALFAGGYLILVGGGAAYGLAGGTWPHVSLQFRWEYWTAAFRAFPEFAATGCGRENFDVAYLRHKSPAHSEQVRNPHGLWVALPVELGPLGLLAGVVLLTGVTARLLSPPRGTGVLDEPGALLAVLPGVLDEGARPATASEVFRLVLASVAVQAYFSATPFDAPGVAIVWGQEVAIAYLLAFLAALRAVEATAATAGGWRFLTIGCGAAAVATLVHNVIDFSLFTPAGLAALVLPVAAGGALLRAAEASRHDGAGWPRLGGTAGGLVTAGLLVGYLGGVWWPSFESQRLMTEMRLAVREAGAFEKAVGLGRLAVRADPLDSEAPRTATQAVLSFALDPRLTPEQQLERLAVAEQFASQARDRRPASPAGWRLLARIAEVRAAMLDEDAASSRSATDVEAARAFRRQAAENWAAVCQRSPGDERAHLAAAMAWGRRWGDSGDRGDAERACGHIAAALAIDVLRAPEAAAKLRASELDTIAQMRRELEESGVACGD
jgi:hypothetical protein